MEYNWKISRILSNQEIAGTCVGQSSRIWYGVVRWQITTPYSTFHFCISSLFTSCPQAAAASGNAVKMSCTPPKLATFVFLFHSALHNKLYVEVI